ncbi:MAG: hypothetical protein N2053_09865 [Chitinispirillaceae bacterium]|nr:hypothetical protein [Chitinispirillaceae bacterium]
MEAKSISKVLEFLKENPHLDVEISDIAFNVKRSEKSVEAALKKLQEKGLVTSRKSENGHIYWYALPSAPITKTIRIENSSNSASTATSKISTLSSTESKEEIEKETIPDLMSEIDKIKNKTAKSRMSSVEESFQQKEGYRSIEKENGAKSIESGKNREVTFLEKYDISKIPITHLAIGIFIAVLIVFFLNVVILIKFAGVSKNIKIIKNVLSKEVVTSSDLNKVVKEFTEKIGGVEEKIFTLNTQIDSLKNQIQKKEHNVIYSKNRPIQKKKIR